MARRNGNTGAAQAAPTLEELAEELQREYEATSEIERETLAHAIYTGEILRQARALAQRGTWENWLKQHYRGGLSSAYRCMQFADPVNLSRVRDCRTIKEAQAAIRKPRDEAKSKPTRKPHESGKRLRALHTKRRQGDDSTLMNMRIRVQQVVSVLEGVGLDEYGVEGADDETITEVHEELTMLAVWLDKSLTVLDSHINQAVRIERIRRLREDTNGRSPAEIDTARKLADKLERKHLVAV